MIRVELKDLQANLDYYLDKLDEGEKIEVLENGKVIYKLTEPFVREPGPRPPRHRKGERKLQGPLGLLDPDEFSSSTPQKIVDLFYSSTLPDSRRK